MLLESSITLLLGAKNFRFPCERGHKHAVFTHALPLLKAIIPSQIARLSKLKNNRCTISAQMVSETSLKKKLEIKKHYLLSCNIFPGLVKSILSPRFTSIFEPTLGCVFGSQGSSNAKRSFVGLRPPCPHFFQCRFILRIISFHSELHRASSQF